MVNKLSDIWMASYISNDGANFWIRSRHVRRCPPGTWTARIDSEYAGRLPHPVPPANRWPGRNGGLKLVCFCRGGGPFTQKKRNDIILDIHLSQKTEFFWFLLKNVYISNFGKVKNHLHVRIMQVPILRQLLLCNDLTIQPGWLTHTCVLLSIFLYQTYLEIPLYSFVSRFLIQLYQQFYRMMERGTKRHSASLGRFVPHHADVVYGNCRGLPSASSDVVYGICRGLPSGFTPRKPMSTLLTLFFEGWQFPMLPSRAVNVYYIILNVN